MKKIYITINFLLSVVCVFTTYKYLNYKRIINLNELKIKEYQKIINFSLNKDFRKNYISFLKNEYTLLESKERILLKRKNIIGDFYGFEIILEDSLPSRLYFFKP
jgi:hypothetical protein